MSISVERENQIIATVSYIHRRMGFYHPPFSFQRFFQLFPDYQIVPARLPQGFDGELLLRQGKKVIRYRLGSRERTIRFTLALHPCPRDSSFFSASGFFSSLSNFSPGADISSFFPHAPGTGSRYFCPGAFSANANA